MMNTLSGDMYIEAESSLYLARVPLHWVCLTARILQCACTQHARCCKADIHLTVLPPGYVLLDRESMVATIFSMLLSGEC